MPSPTIELGDIVRVVNKGSDPFTIGWNSRQYVLEPGKDSFVPFEAACLWFGDPRSSASIQSRTSEQGTVSFIPDRESEIRRLRVKYGNIGGDERFVDPAPKVSLYSLDGTEVITPLSDPEGKQVIAAAPSISDQETLVAQLRRQQEQINFLLGQLGLQTKVEGGDESEEEEDEVDEDGLPPVDEDE